MMTSLIRWLCVALALVALVPSKVFAQVELNVASIFFDAGPRLYAGSADPEGSVAAPPGSFYFRTNGTVYIKASGSGNTGWSVQSISFPITVSQGGTGRTTLTTNGVLYGDGTNPVGMTAAPGVNVVLAGNSSAPFFTSTPTVAQVIATTSMTTPVVTSGASLTLSPTGDLITDPTGDDVLPVTNFDINIGMPTLMYKSLSVGELIAQTLVAQDVIATIGGRVVVGPTTKLTSALSSGATSMVVEHNQMANGDRVLMQASPGGVPQIEWMAITSGPSGGGGGISHVNRAEGYNGASSVSSCSTTAQSHTTGNLLVFVVNRQVSTSITVSDTAGNTWTQAGSEQVNSTNRVRVYYAYNITGNGSNVVTATLSSGTSQHFNCSVRQFSGVQTSSDPIDGTNGANGSSTTASTGTIDISASQAVIVAFTEADGQNISAGSGYTATVFNGGSGDGNYFADEYKIVTADEAATFTVGSGGWAIAGAAFKATPTGGPYTYSVTRNLDGTGANNWVAGDAVFNTGTTGDGFIDLYSISGVLSGFGPTIVGNVRTGTAYNAIEPRWAIGNLNGLYGYSADVHAVALGVPTAAWVKIDPVNGVRIGHNVTTNIHLDASGNASFTGSITAASGTIGGFTIGSQGIIDAGDSMGLASTVTGGDDVRFYAGETFANRGSAEFRVTESGALVATSATITGAITATSGSFTGTITAASGTIGGFSIGSEGLVDAGNSMGLASTVTGGNDPRFWAGDTFANRATAPFVVFEDGSVRATRMTIGSNRNLVRNSECRVGTGDWTLVYTTAITPSLSFNEGSNNLNGESSVCYIAISGTPSNGEQTFGVLQGHGGSIGLAAKPDQVYEASAYIGLQSTSGTTTQTANIILQFFDSSSNQVGSTTHGTSCTTSSAGGQSLAGYCRSYGFATAPANTRYVRMAIRTVYGTGNVSPYTFYVRAMLAESHAGQTDPSEWAGGGITEISNGIIRTDAIDARVIAANAIQTAELDAGAVTAAKIAANTITANEIASNAITTDELNADSVTSAKIAAGTIEGSDIAASTITAGKLSVSTLSAISADIGSITAGSITGVTISGGSVTAGGGNVTLDSNGIQIAAGTGTTNKIDWSDNSYIVSNGGAITIALGLQDANVSISGGGLSIGSDFIVATGTRFAHLGGNGTAFVCTDNDGDIFEQTSACAAPDSLLERISSLEARIAVLEEMIVKTLAPRPVNGTRAAEATQDKAKK